MLPRILVAQLAVLWIRQDGRDARRLTVLAAV
jgi:hypothetical protein